MLLCNKFKVATPTNLRKKCITNHLNHSPRTKLSWRRPLLEKSRRRLACDADLTSPVAGDCPAVARRSPATCLRHTYVTHDRWLAVAGGRRRLLLSPATEKLLRVKGPLEGPGCWWRCASRVVPFESSCSQRESNSGFPGDSPRF